MGLARLEVGEVLVKEPDRGGSFFDLGPRLLMNIADVPATEVVQPGSRIGYRLLLRGADAELEALREELELEPNYRWMDIRRNSRRIGSALDRAESFLLLGGLLGVLLAGVAVALSAHRYARRHYDHVGIFKTLGATPNQILYAYLGILGVVGALSVLLGLALGAGLHLLIVSALDVLIPIELPMPSVRPFLLGAATGFICALAFAMPPLLHLKNISPLRRHAARPGGAAGFPMGELRRSGRRRAAAADLVQPEPDSHALDPGRHPGRGAAVRRAGDAALARRARRRHAGRAADCGWRSRDCSGGGGRVPRRS